jgi:hypothetical protein
MMDYGLWMERFEGWNKTQIINIMGKCGIGVMQKWIFHKKKRMILRYKWHCWIDSVSDIAELNM